MDVYSFGVLLWELTHLRVPFAETGLNQVQVRRPGLKEPKAARTRVDLFVLFSTVFNVLDDRDGKQNQVQARRPGPD